MNRVVTGAAGILLLIHGGSQAHDGMMMHGRMSEADMGMQKLHEMMPRFAQAIPQVEAALGKGDMTVVKAEVSTMLTMTPDLKVATPHKNLMHMETFRRLAAAFERDLRDTESSAERGDLSLARAAFRKAEGRCTECHAKFR